MKLFNLIDSPVTLADYSYNAIAKQGNKMIKYEEKILTENEPENLHQLRVTMRRLRSILSIFNSVIKIPAIINDKNIGDIARTLGEQRDLDILQINLEEKIKEIEDQFEEKESKIIKKIREDISKNSEQNNNEIKLTLTTKKYQQLTLSLTKWLEKPVFRAIADLKIQPTINFLLSPQLSNFYLQSGWLVGANINDNYDIVITKNLSAEEVNNLLKIESKSLHQLRKQAKKTRYQLEIFTSFYPEEYQKCIKFIEEIQETLGNIQDHICLRNYLTQKQGKKWFITMPNLSNKILNDQLTIWEEWQKLQEIFLGGDYSKKLDLIIENPTNNS